MSWKRLIGQQPARNYLSSTLRAGRLGHGFLFTGPAGVGKRTAAYILAQIAMCYRPPAPDEACGECQSCQWIAARSGALTGHPDLINLPKFAKEGKSDKLVGDNDFMIPLQTVNYVCEQLHRSPMAGKRRVVIVPEAQRLCRGQAEAANAFLKTLEEPPASSLIILTSSQPEGLLETIISRVQIVRFRRLSTAEVLGGLRGAQASDAEKEMVAALADGCLGRGIDLLQGDLKKWRRIVLASLEQFNAKSCPGFGLTLWAAAEEEGKRLFEAEKSAGRAEREEESDESGAESDEAAVKTEAGWKRHVFSRLLELCEVSFRDGLVCAAAGAQHSGKVLLQPDQAKLAARLASSFGEEGCLKALQELREAMLAVKLYIKGDMISRALSGKLVDAMVH